MKEVFTPRRRIRIATSVSRYLRDLTDKEVLELLNILPPRRFFIALMLVAECSAKQISEAVGLSRPATDRNICRVGRKAQRMFPPRVTMYVIPVDKFKETRRAS